MRCVDAKDVAAEPVRCCSAAPGRLTLAKGFERSFVLLWSPIQVLKETVNESTNKPHVLRCDLAVVVVAADAAVLLHEQGLVCQRLRKVSTPGELFEAT